MPLIIEGQPMQPLTTISDFIQNYPHFQVKSRHLKAIPPISVDPKMPYLFVHQMESACVSADDPSIQMIGIDDMTTCCCAIVRHTGSFAMGAGHFDGNDTKNGLGRIIDGVKRLTDDWMKSNSIIDDHDETDLPNGSKQSFQYEVHLVGGFDDSRNISIDVVTQLLENLHETPNLDLHLKTACICGTNTHSRDNINYPCVTGLLCDVKTGQLLPASFSYQGPLDEIRRLRFAMLPPIIMHSIYDPVARILEIKPYDWTITDDTINQLLGLNTNSFLHYLSTSPLAEKPNYVHNFKMALKFLRDNRRSLFCSNKSYRLIRTNGRWKLIE